MYFIFFVLCFRLKSDLVVVSCDCITNISLFPLLNSFRRNDASLVVQLFKGGMEADAVVPGPKAKHKQGINIPFGFNINSLRKCLLSDRDLIGIQSDTQRLTFLASMSDFEETVRLSQTLLQRYGHFTMHSRLVDSHIYVLKKWIVDYLYKVNQRHHKNQLFLGFKAFRMKCFVNVCALLFSGKFIFNSEG